MSSELIRVVVAADEATVRAKLSAILGGTPGIQVVGEARHGVEAVALVTRTNPHLMLIDLSVPEMDGIAATREINRRGLPTRVLALTPRRIPDDLHLLMEAGAAGYLMSVDAARDLVEAVRAVMTEGVYRPRAVG